jgi:MFS transporter, OFA family, oxalate/formate antiporter
VLPLIAHFAIQQHDWRVGWLAVGGTVLLVGFLPVWLLVVRRPEDVGLVPDGRLPLPAAGGADVRPLLAVEPAFSRRQALRTPAFWLLSLYTIAIFPVQAGVSLHQASHAIERGLSPAVAATIVSAFSLTAALSGLVFGLLARRAGVRALLVLGGALMGLSAILMIGIASNLHGYLAGCCFGAGIGGILTVLPLAWADYFGRASFGAIRGVALTMQVTAQAAGPLISGVLRDLYGSYVASLTCFAALAFFGCVVALLARPPSPPKPQPTT